MQKNEESLNRVLDLYPYLENTVKGLPNLGKRLDGSDFSCDVFKIYDAFELYGNDIYSLENDKIKNMSSKSLGGGSPMRTKPFKGCKKEINKFLKCNKLSDYPMAAGDEQARKNVCSYLLKEGFKSDGGISHNNIIFTVSTTDAFNLIMKLIARPYDVILMTGPNYGLFTFVPERAANATVKILPLSSDDNWFVNPQKLEERIDEINKELEQEYKGKLSYTPKVVAFLNENPHNPLGKVMNKKNSYLLEKIGDICLKKGVFVIDDIIYRDLTYDRENLALPMGTYKKFFENTITITGLSKSYGLASIRSGMIIASEIIIRGIRNLIFQNMDSSPVLQGKALAGAFNDTSRRYREYEKYFKHIMKEYEYRLKLLIALVEGINTINDTCLRSKITKDVKKYCGCKYDYRTILEGIPNVNVVKNSIPESGFFVLLDYTKLKGKVSKNGRKIVDEKELLKHFYENEKIKLILGQSISWPEENKLIGRVTTALSRKDLVLYFSAMNDCVKDLR